MISTKGSQVAFFELTPDLFSKTLKKRLGEAHRQAVRVWLKTILENIPTYTGTARGTFRPLGRVLNIAVQKTKVLGKTDPSKKKWIYVKGRKWRAGIDYGESYGGYSLWWQQEATRIIYGFSFTSDLPYLLWNEVYPAPVNFVLPSNPPWRAFRKAALAFLKYVKIEVPKQLPKSAHLHKIHIVRVK